MKDDNRTAWNVDMGNELPFANTIAQQGPEISISKLEEIKEEGLILLNLNVNSILANDGAKLIQLTGILKKMGPVVVGITESWLTENNSNEEVEVEGYKLFRRDRKGKKGGGVMVYIKEEYPVKELDFSDPNENSPSEILWVKVEKLGRENTIIGICYRPPTETGFIEKLEDQVDLALDESTPIILMGDFNIDLRKRNNTSQEYERKMTNLGFEQVIEGPTRVRNGCYCTLDHIWIKGLECLDSGTTAGLSDHLCTYGRINGKKVKIKGKKKYWGRDYRGYRRDKFENILKQTRIQDIVMENSDINDDVMKFEERFLEGLNKIAPFKWHKKKIRNRRPWKSTELETLWEEKNKAEIKAIHTGKDNDWDNFHFLQRKFNSVNKESKRGHYKNKLEKASKNNKEVWRVAKEIFPSFRKKSESKIEGLNGNQEKELGNKFNEHYLNIVENLGIRGEQFQETISQNTQIVRNFFSLKEVESPVIEKIIKEMDSSKAGGIDNIKINHLKDALSVVTNPITKIVNKSIRNGKFPSRYKESIIVPIVKNSKKDRLDPGNNRPVSLLPVIGKIIERVIQTQVTEFLNNENLISEHQHGFRKNHSTVTCLIEMMENVRESLDKGMVSGMVAIDLSKAFDTIRHKTLVQKLKSLNFDANTISWFESYLKDRKQKVKINDTISNEGNVKHGVPQGSILGPLLFSLYINDLPENAGECKVKIYADDTTLYTSSNTVESLKLKLEHSLERVERYFENIGLKMNADKCQFMIMRNVQTAEEITLNVNGHILHQSDNVKILGVILDKKLKWDCHINEITKKCRSLMGILFKGRHFIDQDTRKLLFNAIVQSRLNYADVVWDSCSEKLNNQLQKIQNSGIRFIFGLKKFDHVSEYRQILKWVDVKGKRKQHTLQLFHKIKLNRSPLNLLDKINNSEINHGHDTRSATRGNLATTYARTNVGRNGFIKTCY